jgi:hypothetical protein
VASYVEEVLQFVTRRGHELGLLEAEVCGRYEPPWFGEEAHPLLELQAMTEELDSMARAIVEGLMDEISVSSSSSLPLPAEMPSLYTKCSCIYLLPSLYFRLEFYATIVSIV